MAGELEVKLERVRRLLHQRDADAAFFTTSGNVSWLLCGGDPLVSLTDPPVASILVTRDQERLFMPEFERDRLENEEMPAGLTCAYLPWEEPNALNEAREALADPARTLTDQCAPGTRLHDFWQLRVPLLPEELDRYRSLGADAAQAVGDVMRELEPGPSEHEIAGRVAVALRSRGIQPALLLVGADARLKRYRHPIPSGEAVHERVMVVVCARRHGLYANLSRIAAFTPLGPQEARRYASLLEIEAAALQATRHGRFMRDVLLALQNAYAEHHHPLAWKHHHQGGPTGYFTRDFLATGVEQRVVVDGAAYAWNPSLPGIKVEDTVLLTHQRLELLTYDPLWPKVEVEGVERPEVLLRG
ncbi:MAG TPA: M24 family metallopeptidase [Trueperaceae bacterium]